MDLLPRSSSDDLEDARKENESNLKKGSLSKLRQQVEKMSFANLGKINTHNFNSQNGIGNDSPSA